MHFVEIDQLARNENRTQTTAHKSAVICGNNQQHPADSKCDNVYGGQTSAYGEQVFGMRAGSVSVRTLHVYEIWLANTPPNRKVCYSPNAK